MTDDDSRAWQLQSELLELLYWLEGEGFGTDATVPTMLRFIAYAEPEVRATLDRLIARGDIVQRGETYLLTDLGRSDAKRRFADDFAELMHHGHGECEDPACECHMLGVGECRVRARTT